MQDHKRVEGVGAGRRLLLVDDDATMRRSVRRLLVRDAWEVVEAGSVAEGLGALATPIDVAIVDLRLPDGTGLELVQGAREAQPQARVFVMSGLANRGEAFQAAQVGATGFIEKPFGASGLR